MRIAVAALLALALIIALALVTPIRAHDAASDRGGQSHRLF